MTIDALEYRFSPRLPKPNNEFEEKHEKRLAYRKNHQEDKRAATKLGISVKEFRAAKGKEE